MAQLKPVTEQELRRLKSHGKHGRPSQYIQIIDDFINSGASVSRYALDKGEMNLSQAQTATVSLRNAVEKLGLNRKITVKRLGNEIYLFNNNK